MHTYHTEEQLKQILEEYLIYLRKSRSDNPKETVEETLARHEEELQSHAKEHLGGYIGEENIYREVVSGGEDIEERPEFVKVLKRMEKGDIKGVLVVDTARLSRAGIYGAGDIINAFLYTNTHIVTPIKTYDLSQKFDKKFIEMEMLKSNEYLDYTKEVLGNGKLRSLRAGCFIGAFPPFGFDKEKLPHKGWKLVPVEHEAKAVQRIFQLYCEEDLGYSAIATQLKKEGYTNRSGLFITQKFVRYALQNEHYIGKIVWGKQKEAKVLRDGKLVKVVILNPNPYIFEGQHEAIISEELFDKAQEKLNSVAKPTPRTKSLTNPLASLVRCKSCGKVMVRRTAYKTNRTSSKRVKEPDKEKLWKTLREAKYRSRLTLAQITEKLDTTPARVSEWFAYNPERFNPAKSFSQVWPKMKELLNITTDEFDEDLLTYEPIKNGPILLCKNINCNMVSHRLDHVEAEILSTLKNYLKDYRYFLDNYEEEITKVVAGNVAEIKFLKAQIEKYQKAKKNALRNLNMEDITREEYLEEKAELESLIAKCEAELAKLEENKEEDKLIKYKKAVPILEKCVDQYYSLQVKEQNELLKAIVKNVEYSKAGKEFKLEVELLI